MSGLSTWLWAAPSTSDGVSSGISSGGLILMIVLAVLILAAIIIFVHALTEPYLLKVTTRKLYPAENVESFRRQERDSSASTVASASTPASATYACSAGKPGLRLFFFSDLHAEICKIKPERVIAAIREANSASPLDAVVFGGDICNNYEVNDTGLSYLKHIADACVELGIPFYGVTGNHDHKFDPSDRKLVFDCIEDRQIPFVSRATGKNIVLCGVDDSGRHERVWYKVPSVPADAVSVAVIHNPDSILHFDEGTHVDYMLSGHFHAGQIKMPFRFEFIALRSDTLPQRNVIEGVFEHKGTTLFISRGVGCNKLPLRFLATPEVSVVEIYA